MSNKHEPAGVGMTPCKTELGSFIRARRLELDLRQVPLAKKCGFTQTVVSQLEIGERKYLNERQLNKLAKVLRVDPEELRKRMPVKPGSQPRTELGRLIRSRREELGFSLSALAKKLKMTTRQAKRLEVNRRTSIRYELIQPLAKALDLEISSLTRFTRTVLKPCKRELGRLVRTRRLELGMSANELAEKLDVSKSLVSLIELGQLGLSKDDGRIAQLAQALELDIDKLEALRPARRRKPRDNADPLGEFLATKRFELRLTQQEVAQRAGIKAQVVCHVETGRTHPDPDLLDKLAKALNCEVPREFFPPPPYYSGGCNEPRYRIPRTSALEKFVTERRLELGLTQPQLAQKAGLSPHHVIQTEHGRKPEKKILDKLFLALDCVIPAELVPAPEPNASDSFPVPSATAHLSDQDMADIEKIKELSGIRVDTEAVRRALKLLRRLLEKQGDGYVIRLRKDEDAIELELLF